MPSKWLGCDPSVSEARALLCCVEREGEADLGIVLGLPLKFQILKTSPFPSNLMVGSCVSQMLKQRRPPLLIP